MSHTPHRKAPAKPAAKPARTAQPADTDDLDLEPEPEEQESEQEADSESLTDAFDNLHGKIHGLSAGSELSADQVRDLRSAADEYKRALHKQTE